MADDTKRTIPPRPRQPSRPSFDDSETARQLAEAQSRESRLLEELAAERKAREAAQAAQRRAPVSDPPGSSKAALRLQVSDWKGLAGFVTALAGLGLGGSAWLAKAPAPRVENQGTVIAATREELNAVASRVEALERSDRKQNALARQQMDYLIQVLADGKVAIVTRPQGLPPMRPIETHWPRSLPGRGAVAPILIVDTPYPSIEWVTE